MKTDWRKWNRVLHRDLGYFFVGMTIIYALSGIALNHMADWNPSYAISHGKVNWDGIPAVDAIDRATVLGFLKSYGEDENYKKHYFPSSQRLKIFLKNGSINLDVVSGNGIMEKIRRRAVFFEVNYLHYNPRRLWTWFSDIYCVALILIAITGLFVLKGSKGIKGRGALLGGIGILIPLLFLIAYL